MVETRAFNLNRSNSIFWSVHVAYTKSGTPYFKEADAVIECEVMYAAPFGEKNFRNDVPKKTYSNFPAGIHSMYIGEVVGVWKK